MPSSTRRLRAPPGIGFLSAWALLLAGATTACVTAGGEGASATSTATESTTAMSTTTTNTDGMSSTSAAGTASTGATTTTTAETSGESLSGAETSGCLRCPPDGGPVGAFECDLWLQDCPEGQKCNAWAPDGGGAWNATKCVPVDPDPDKVNEPCTVEGSGVSGIDSCEKGAMCWDVNPMTNMGMCIALCQGDEEKCNSEPGSCCPAGSACTIPANGVLILCLPFCDPLLQDCLGSGEVCYPVGEIFQCAPDVSGDMGAIGDPCEYINVCDPGTYCGDPAKYPGCDPNAAGCCIPFCSLKAPECAMGTECQPWYDPMAAPPGFEDVGACLIP